MFTRVITYLNNFLFHSHDPKKLGLMRALLCSVIAYIAIFRQFNMDQYDLHSIIPRSQALSIYPDFYRPLFEYFFWPDSLASVVHVIFIVLIVLAALGLTNRIVMLLTWVLLMGFINRNYSIVFGADLIGALFLFYLSFTDCTSYFSLKNYFNKNKIQAHNQTIALHKGNWSSQWSSQLSSVFLRLMQFQIAIIYAYTGFEKLKGSSWWDGTALWTVMVNPQFSIINFEFLRHFPLVFAIGTFVTLIFEIYFPVMVLFKKTKLWWLGLGVLFHSMIGLLLSLFPFSLIMISTYFLFLDEDDRLMLKQKIRKARL